MFYTINSNNSSTELNGKLETEIIVETDSYLIIKTGNTYVANFYGYNGGNQQLCDAIHMPTQSQKHRGVMFDDTNRRAVHCYISGSQFTFYDTQIGVWATGNIFGQIVWQI